MSDIKNSSTSQSSKVQHNGIEKKSTSRNQLNSDSSYSIDVLSGGESEYESLRKKSGQSDNMIKSESIQTGSDTLEQKRKRFPADKNFFIVKELLMTERTYKKDLEVLANMLRDKLLTNMEKEWCEDPLWESLDSLMIHQASFLHGLEIKLCTRIPQTESNYNVVWEKNGLGNMTDMHYVGQLMLDHFSESSLAYDRWITEHLVFLKKLEQTCAESPPLERLCREIEVNEKACYLPLYTYVLKPLYRLLHYKNLLTRASESYQTVDNEYKILTECLSNLQQLCDKVGETLSNSLNYSYLCLLRRDVDGLDNLVVPNRSFVRQGCLFKYTSKGPQQRMFFLFSDILVYSNKGSHSHQQFRVHGIIPVHSIQIELAEYTNSFSIYGGGRAMTLSANSSSERDLWMSEIKKVTAVARSHTQENLPMTKNLTASSSAEELTDNSDSSGVSLQRNNTLAHVCWHRNISLSWKHLTIAMENELSGYLLRKFKNSQGWQRLWVVFASFCLYFYKTCHDDFPLASLPLLGYVVTKPNEKDSINKDFVFKLIFKNHIYFFRAESEFTYQRWMEVIGSATTKNVINNE